MAAQTKGSSSTIRTRVMPAPGSSCTSTQSFLNRNLAGCLVLDLTEMPDRQDATHHWLRVVSIGVGGSLYRIKSSLYPSNAAGLLPCEQHTVFLPQIRDVSACVKRPPAACPHGGAGSTANRIPLTAPSPMRYVQASVFDTSGNPPPSPLNACRSCGANLTLDVSAQRISPRVSDISKQLR